MSRRYSIIIQLDASYNRETIENILAKGLKLKMEYNKFMDCGGQLLDVKSAADWCLEEDNGFDVHCLEAKIAGIYTHLHFINQSGDVRVMLSGISCERLKQFKNGAEDIDIASYAKVMIDLIDDYRILEMKIEKD